MMQMKAFEQWLECHHLAAASQLLWFRLAGLSNRCGWPAWVSADNHRLMGMIQVKREATFIAVRNALIEGGLIAYRRGRKGVPGQYRLVELRCAEAVGGENRSENRSASGSAKRSTKRNQTAAQTAAIEKPDQTTPDQGSPAGDRARGAPFRPPDPREVEAYCRERGNGIDGQRFVDYYAARGWMAGRARMKDWRAAVRTWERQEDGRGARHGDPARDGGSALRETRGGDSGNVFADMARALREEGSDAG